MGCEQLLDKLTEIARTAERTGFTSVTLMDHLHQIPGVGPRTNWMLEGNAGLAALAARTSTIHLGLLVGGVTYRNPAFMAKATTTIDVPRARSSGAITSGGAAPASSGSVSTNPT